MNTTAYPPIWHRLSDVAAAATLAIGALSAASYAFALGYVFAIEPRFLPAFSFGDLLRLFLTSTSTMIFLTITLVPSLAMLFSRGLFTSFLREADFGPDAVKALPPAVPIPVSARMEGRHWAGAAVSVGVSLSLIALILQDAFSGEPTTFSPYPEFLLTFGFVLILWTTSSSQLMRAALPLVMSLFVLAAFYVVGDASGRRDLVGSSQARQMPCAYLVNRSDCFDVILIGTDVVLLRKNGRVLLVSRERVRTIQGEGVGGEARSNQPSVKSHKVSP